MLFGRPGRVVSASAVFWIAASSVATAQVLTWDVFEDTLSSSLCDVVNAENAELVVLSDTGQLVIVTGPDVLLEDTLVTLEGDVFFEGLPAGFIAFEEDGDGFRTVWWLALTGTVVNVDGFTGEPAPTNLFPTDFVDVPCDASQFWDGCLDDSDCADGDGCTIDICNAGVCEYAEILGCGDDTGPSGPIVLNICGTGSGMAMVLTAFGLGVMTLHRRRFD